jgi:GT2 family glycosyltransferase
MSQATPAATVVIPTRARTDYLEVSLASIAPQIRALGAELLVVSDGPDPDSAGVAARHGAVFIELPTPSGANAARNAAVAASNPSTELLVFVDDDVEAPDGWLQAILDGAAANPEHEVLGGPIIPRLEGGGPRHCGREPAPITALDQGPHDLDGELVWSANMAIRRTALERVGPFAEAIRGRGEEEEWQERYRADGGRIRYLAAAGLTHRRAPADARLRPLLHAAYPLGRSARRNDARKGSPPTLRRELRDLAGAGWHSVARQCAYGLVFAAHSAGRIRETLDPIPQPPAAEFMSGESGYVAGIRATTIAKLKDAVSDVARAPERRRLRHDASLPGPRRRVLALAIERTGVANLLDATEAELLRSRHEVRFVRTDVGDRGKFENLNALLAGSDPTTHPSNHGDKIGDNPDPMDLDYDWLLVIDDDVALPAGFLDQFLFLAERFELSIAQPAHRAYSHAAWRVTRRRRGSVVRETAFVEIGPVVAFQRRTFETLLPFPPLKAGWGLDAHWAALATQKAWRIGIVDATAIEHALRPVAASYDASAAVAEAHEFLADRPHITTAEAQTTRERHRVW